MFDDVEKIYDKERLEPKGRKSFLNCNLLISELLNRLGTKNVTPIIPKLHSGNNMKSQRVF